MGGQGRGIFGDHQREQQGTSTSIKNLFNYNWSDVTGLELAAGEFSAKNAGQITAENYNASEKVTLKAIGRNYASERFGWDKDRFAASKTATTPRSAWGACSWSLPKTS